MTRPVALHHDDAGSTPALRSEGLDGDPQLMAEQSLQDGLGDKAGSACSTSEANW